MKSNNQVVCEIPHKKYQELWVLVNQKYQGVANYLNDFKSRKNHSTGGFMINLIY
ncbi:MAG: hypothetical protein MRJ93_00415 [Nitrososphaeraceae archaeon]|nr:hypothetical protein [Nitrososphaeraceae archaeon]